MTSTSLAKAEYLFVTSWSKDGFESYGKKFLESWEKFTPANSVLRVVDDEYLAGDKEFVDFKNRWKVFLTPDPGRPWNYRYDVIRFAHKVFALTAPETIAKAKEVGARYIVWIDGDVVFHKAIPIGVMQTLFPKDFDGVYLSRKKVWYHSECGFVGYNLELSGEKFLFEFRDTYIKGEALLMAEWHDSFIFDRCREAFESFHGARWLDICPETDPKDPLNAFAASPLNHYMTHLKGNQKSIPAPVVFKDRYEQLEAIVEYYKPARIVEVGTWSGDRAIRLALAAKNGGAEKVHYRGYDVFEQGDAELDARELNVKKHFSISDVANKLSVFAHANPWFSFELSQGLTSETLWKNPPKDVDFAFIDGGHSVDTIKGDFEALKSSPVIVMDDFYSADENGKAPDISKFGCNTTFPAGVKIRVLESKDRVKEGGFVHIALVTEKDPPPILTKSGTAKTRGDGNLKLQTRNCRPDIEIQANVLYNHHLVQQRIKYCRPHTGKAIIVSGGHSVRTPEMVANLKAEIASGGTVFCVKHAHQWLLDNGIVPWGVVLLDPRPHTGLSTHGEERAPMLANVQKGTKVFAASMVDPSVTMFLRKKGVDLWLWHAAVDAGERKVLPNNEMVILGGSSSAVRTINVAYALGFRNFILFGMDSCHLDEGALDKSKKMADGVSDKYFRLAVTVHGQKREFWTDVDLLAQAQDFEAFIKAPETHHLHIEVRGEGMLRYLWENLRPTGLTNFEDLFKT